MLPIDGKRRKIGIVILLDQCMVMLNEIHLFPDLFMCSFDFCVDGAREL
jgi:hypothetical protein